jgi:type VI secretion system protein ImpI
MLYGSRAMAFGLRLIIRDSRDGTTFDRTAASFPVRIGRNPLNDVQLDYPFVSQFHAVLELDGTVLTLRDLGSRNGTQINGQAIPGQQPIDLAPYQYQFGFGPLQIRAEPAQIAPEQSAGNRMAAAAQGNFAQTALVGAQDAVRVGRTLIEMRASVKAWNDSFTALRETLERAIAPLDPSVKLQVIEGLFREYPELARHPDMHRLAASFGGSNLASAAASDDALVAQAVRDLAHKYVPSQPMRTGAQAVAFVGKMQDALDVFFKAFIPLRDGHKQFETKMEIRRNTARPDGRQAADMTVRRTPDVATLAARVLDFTDPSSDAAKALAGVFADLMIHQVAMLDGVMRGVKQLLRELSPAALEALAEKKKLGGFGPFRFKSLWKLYQERHADLADEDTETFELIFGRQFVSAYSQLADVQAVNNG